MSTVKFQDDGSVRVTAAGMTRTIPTPILTALVNDPQIRRLVMDSGAASEPAPQSDYAEMRGWAEQHVNRVVDKHPGNDRAQRSLLALLIRRHFEIDDDPEHPSRLSLTAYRAAADLLDEADFLTTSDDT